ncbi:MAG: hypothetical protein QNL61_08990 [Crocinitomicaceae bacterium]
MNNITLLIFLIVSTLTFGQQSPFTEDEENLLPLLDKLRSAENNADRDAANKVFRTELASVLAQPGSIEYPFSKLTTVGFINSPDKQMRIVNYNIEQDDLSQNYTCFIIYYDKRKKEQFVTELKDNSFGMPTQPTEILASDEWYGALYYKIIPVSKGSKTIYTVLGWDYYGPSSQIKIIDAIYVSGSTVKLGSPIFKQGRETMKRVYFEHSKKSSMALNYDEGRKRIIFDHLSPESPTLKNYKSYYVPDMSYDAFEFDDGKWVLEEDVIGTNSGEDPKKQYVYVKDEKTGKVVKKEVKVKWINPEDANAPGGGYEHVAITPENAKENETKEGKSNMPKADKNDKRDPSQVSFYDDVVNKKRKKKK